MALFFVAWLTMYRICPSVDTCPPFFQMSASHGVLALSPSARSSSEISLPIFARFSRRPWHLSSSRRRSSSGVSIKSVSQKSKVTPAILNRGVKSTSSVYTGSAVNLSTSPSRLDPNQGQGICYVGRFYSDEGLGDRRFRLS